MKFFRFLFLVVLLCAMFVQPGKVSAVGEAATKIGVFAPPSANGARLSTLIVTALEDGSTVDIIDDGADGDTDDSHTGLTMNTGQSYITYIKEGTVIDDNGGKADGDFFWVKSNKPVMAHTLTVNTDWQHDFVPADNHRMSGTSFYVYTPNFIDVNTTKAPEVIDVFAYNDNTDVKLLDITATAKTTSGLTTVTKDASAVTLYTNTLNAGQDLIEAKGITWRLAAGHTYHILANKAVTVNFGAIGKNRSTSRDGGDYVPGKNGFSSDKTFYFTIPNQQLSERELRLVSYSKPADVTVRGWNPVTKVWDKVGTYALPVFGHVDLVATAAGTYVASGITSGYYFYEVTADNDISVFEANWMETGAYGTSDLATYISSEDGTGAGSYFLAYMGPPGSTTGGLASHVIVSTTAAAKIRLYDPDSFGEYVELYNNSSQTVNLAGWKLTNTAGWTLTIPAGKTVAPFSTFLMEYHEKATDTAANYVYGVDFPKFKLDNGKETLLLQNPGATYSDTLAYTDTGWGLHGVYHALERKNPALPFSAGNAQDSNVAHSMTNNNLGDYYGTPGVQGGSAGGGGGSIVINEVMSGRLYQTVSMAANSYYKYDVSEADWKALNNGEAPGTNNGNPEKSYIVVDSDVPVTVLASNWNDNWMTFATGSLAPDPMVHSEANFYQQQAGSTVVISTYVENDSTTLSNPSTTIELPSTVTVTSYSTPSQIAAVTPSTTQNGDGSTTMTWNHDKPLPPGDVYRFDVEGTIKPATPVDSLIQSVVKVTGKDDSTNTIYASQDSNVITVGTPEATAVSEVVINEVNVSPLCTEQWIELHNKSTALINLKGWELSNESGFIYRFPDGTFIPNDGYLTVHLSNGTNTTTNLYTTQAYGGALVAAEDQVALYRSSTHNAASMVDFTQWASNGVLLDNTQDVIAAAAGQWTHGSAIPAAAAGQAIGRDRYATDGNAATDWTSTGGKDSNHPTSGSVNIAIPGTDTTPPAPVVDLSVQPVLGQEGAVTLKWTNPANGDLAGVKIIRSFDTYPSRFSDEVPVYSGISGVFNETGLPAGQPVYYTAFAFDDKGNVACPVPSSKGRAISPQREYMVYEDLKGGGWVDWDTNDLVVMEDSAVKLNADGVQKIDILFEAKARGSYYNHSFNLSLAVNGNASAQVDKYDDKGVLLSSTTTSHNGGIDLVIFDSTQTALPGNYFDNTSNSRRGSGTRKGFTTRVSITFSSPALNPTTTADLPPFDPWIHVINTNQNIHLMQGGSIGNSQMVWDANSPLYGRDLPLGLSFNQAWDWPSEGTPIWSAYSLYPPYVLSGGTTNLTWFNYPNSLKVWNPSVALASDPQPAAVEAPSGTAACSSPFAACAPSWPKATAGAVFASPLVTDVNGDGNLELVVAYQEGTLNQSIINVMDASGNSLPGWPNRIYSTLRSSPAVGDIDGDGVSEIIVGDDGGYLHAWHLDHTEAFNTIRLDSTIRSTPALADVNGDNTKEIILTTGALKVYVIRVTSHAAQILSPWPIQMGGVVDDHGNQILVSTPAVGDMDGDGVPEIVAGSTDNKVYAWHLDGTALPRPWPKATRDWVYSSPLIVDLNQDGIRDVVALSGDGRVYAWDASGLDLPGFPVRVRGGFVASPVVVDLDGDSNLEVICTTVLGKVYVVRSDGSLMSGWPRDVLSTTYSSPVVGDIDGIEGLEVIVGSHSGKVYAWHANGIPVIDWPKTTGDWVVGSPALGDLDGDSKMEVVAGSYDKNIYIWKTEGDASIAPWSAFRGGPAHSGLVETSTAITAPKTLSNLFMPVIGK